MRTNQATSFRLNPWTNSESSCHDMHLSRPRSRLLKCGQKNSCALDINQSSRSQWTKVYVHAAPQASISVALTGVFRCDAPWPYLCSPMATFLGATQHVSYFLPFPLLGMGHPCPCSVERRATQKPSHLWWLCPRLHCNTERNGSFRQLHSSSRI